MSHFLLSTQTLFDISRRQNLPAERWLEGAAGRGIYKDDIAVSAVALMSIEQEVNKRINDAAQETSDGGKSRVYELHKLLSNAKILFKNYVEDQRVINVDGAICERWGWLLETKITFEDQDGKPYDIGSVQKLEIACAIIGRNNIKFTYVDNARDAAGAISDLVMERPIEMFPDGTT